MVRALPAPPPPSARTLRSRGAQGGPLAGRRPPRPRRTRGGGERGGGGVRAGWTSTTARVSLKVEVLGHLPLQLGCGEGPYRQRVGRCGNSARSLVLPSLTRGAGPLRGLLGLHCSRDAAPLRVYGGHQVGGLLRHFELPPGPVPVDGELPADAQPLARPQISAPVRTSSRPASVPVSQSPPRTPSSPPPPPPSPHPSPRGLPALPSLHSPAPLLTTRRSASRAGRPHARAGRAHPRARRRFGAQESPPKPGGAGGGGGGAGGRPGGAPPPVGAPEHHHLRGQRLAPRLRAHAASSPPSPPAPLCRANGSFPQVSRSPRNNQARHASRTRDVHHTEVGASPRRPPSPPLPPLRCPAWASEHRGSRGSRGSGRRALTPSRGPGPGPGGSTLGH